MFVLELANLLIADAGKYKCTVENGFSKAITTSLTLIVYGKLISCTKKYKLADKVIVDFYTVSS